MFKLVLARCHFFDISLPDHAMIREKNELTVDIAALPKFLNAPPRDRQRLVVTTHFNLREFMCAEPFEVASAIFYYDIYTNRDVHLIELYRIAKSVAESMKHFLISKNIPYLQNEEFPLDPPDVIRARLAPELKKVNEPYMRIMQN
jgi:hypothetical protein